MPEAADEKPRESLLYRLLSWCGRRWIAVTEWIFRKYSRSGQGEPEWPRQLCLRADEMRLEFLGLYDGNLREFPVISPEQGRITQGSSWKVFIFKAFGRTLLTNCVRCPKTAKICLTIPEITSAAFSVLEPGTHISPHRGIYAGVLRCLIPLIVPEGDCGIRVGNKTSRWELGRPFLFDDTVEHEAWNNTGERRVVLFIDYMRPLPLPLAIINRFMIWLIGVSPYIGRMMRASL